LHKNTAKKVIGGREAREGEERGTERREEKGEERKTGGGETGRKERKREEKKGSKNFFIQITGHQ
jgi:hypothetical protein